MKATNPIHQESIDYISQNINAKTSEILAYLLEHWLIDGDIADYFESPTSSAPFLIFKYALEARRKTLGKESALSSIEEIALFGQFQLIVRTALGREKGMAISPVNLFDFNNYSRLNITIL